MDIQRIILGTAGIGGVWGKVDTNTSINTILTAFENGISAIDTAPAYGDAELFVGKALKQWQGPMPQISTKVGRLKSYASDVGIYDYSPQGIERSVVNSLKTLDINFIDLLFLHEPNEMKENQVQGVLEKLQELKRKGYIGKIGIGGNSPIWFEKYITPDVFEIAMEFNRLDACCINAFHTSLPKYQSSKIEYYAASPLHMGLLGCHFDLFVNNPPNWLAKHDIENAKKVHDIAMKHRLQLPSLAHRFLLTVPGISKIVIGASDSGELQKTLADIKGGTLSKMLYLEIINKLSQN